MNRIFSNNYNILNTTLNFKKTETSNHFGSFGSKPLQDNFSIANNYFDQFTLYKNLNSTSKLPTLLATNNTLTIKPNVNYSVKAADGSTVSVAKVNGIIQRTSGFTSDTEKMRTQSFLNWLDQISENKVEICSMSGRFSVDEIKQRLQNLSIDTTKPFKINGQELVIMGNGLNKLNECIPYAQKAYNSNIDIILHDISFNKIVNFISIERDFLGKDFSITPTSNDSGFLSNSYLTQGDSIDRFIANRSIFRETISNSFSGEKEKELLNKFDEIAENAKSKLVNAYSSGLDSTFNSSKNMKEFDPDAFKTNFGKLIENRAEQFESIIKDSPEAGYIKDVGIVPLNRYKELFSKLHTVESTMSGNTNDTLENLSYNDLQCLMPILSDYNANTSLEQLPESLRTINLPASASLCKAQLEHLISNTSTSEFLISKLQNMISTSLILNTPSKNGIAESTTPIPENVSISNSEVTQIQIDAFNRFNDFFESIKDPKTDFWGCVQTTSAELMALYKKGFDSTPIYMSDNSIGLDIENFCIKMSFDWVQFLSKHEEKPK